MKTKTQPDYPYYKQALHGHSRPLAYLDLDLLQQNARDILHRSNGKKVRIASKSVRSRWVLRHLLDLDAGFQGLMCFTALEAVWLSQEGFDDLLIAYPFVDAGHIRAVCGEVRQGKQLICMVDSVAHLDRLASIAAEENVVLPVCLDLDLSLRLPGLNFGVYRSPIRSVEDAVALAKSCLEQPQLRLMSLMGYEAQVAGVGDRVPGYGIKGPVVRWLKKRSIRKVREKREAVVKALQGLGVQLDIVNGGGTGSMESTCAEAVVTEVTAGSGFFASHLFDYYDNFQHLPAAGFAVDVVRQPEPGIYTCLGGGYVASGSTGPEKQPLPHLPAGMNLHPNEGAGEVQTPLLYKGSLEIGDPVLFRHSKAGELSERFREFLLIQNGKVIDRIPTYRGEGKCFL